MHIAVQLPNDVASGLIEAGQAVDGGLDISLGGFADIASCAAVCSSPPHEYERQTSTPRIRGCSSETNVDSEIFGMSPGFSNPTLDLLDYGFGLDAFQALNLSLQRLRARVALTGPAFDRIQ